MSEVIICWFWERTGPCWASCTTPSLPSEGKLVVIVFFLVEKVFRWHLVSFKWEPLPRGSLRVCEAGERDVAKRGHGHPCGQQPVDEINGHCAQQGTKASRIWYRFWNPSNFNQSQCRTGPQSVSYLFSNLFLVALNLHLCA